MGIPDGAHTHGGGGLDPTPILIVLAVALAAGPVMAAVGAIVHVFIVAAAVVLGVSAVGLIGLLIWRRQRRPEVARVIQSSVQARAARPLPESRPALEPRRELHLHFHGVDAADVAAIIRAQQEDRL
jgi:hypothetical protein